MTRQKVLAHYVKDHEDLTIAEIGFIKQALLYYETVYGELDDDYELEVNCAVEIYLDHINEQNNHT